MCLRTRQLDTKGRRQLILGNSCLAAGLMLRLFASPSNHNAQLWLHAAVGFLLGLAITANLFAVLRARRCRETTA